MFGGSKDETLNELEQVVIDEIDRTIKGAEDIASLVPPMPTQVARLTGFLQDPHADFERLEAIIETDAAISGEMIRLANSPLYKRPGVEVVSLSSAVRSLGMNSVVDIATTVLMGRVLEIKPVYFRRFGKLIWDHSQHCAITTKQLAGEDPFGQFYLLGLVHDVGKVVIFGAMVAAFSRADPGTKPGSTAFKVMMVEYSDWLSWRIAEAWSLPDSLVQALKQQRYEEQTREGQVLHLGNVICEQFLLVKQKCMTFDECLERIIAIDGNLTAEDIEGYFSRLDPGS